VTGDQMRLRFSLVDGPELRCPHCGEWWAITPDCWRTNKWDRCLACNRERGRLYQALRRRDPAFRADAALYQRRYRSWLRRSAPELMAAYERERSARRRQQARERRARAA
jgi:hypothetical protein